MPQSSVSTSINVDFPIAPTATGDIQRGLNLQELFQEDAIIGVKFDVTLPPLIPQNGVEYFSWCKQTVPRYLSDTVLMTEGIAEFRIVSALRHHFRGRVSPDIMHLYVHIFKTGIVLTGILYENPQNFDLHDFLTNIAVTFKASNVDVKINTIHSIDK